MGFSVERKLEPLFRKPQPMTPADLSLAHLAFEQLEPCRLARTEIFPHIAQSAHSSPSAPLLGDYALLQSLGSEGLLRNMQTQRAHTMYFLSFVLRHSLTWIAYTLERLNRSLCPAPFPFAEHSPFVHYAGALWDATLAERETLIGVRTSITARGFEWSIQPTDRCHFFDPYQPRRACKGLPTEPGGACAAHQMQLWPPPTPTVPDKQLTLRLSRHQTMLSFYADFRNLRAYSQTELEDMIQSFYKRLLSCRKNSLVHQSQAAVLLGYASLDDALDATEEDLKGRYRTCVKQAHPDTGGTPLKFQALQDAYAHLQKVIRNQT